MRANEIRKACDLCGNPIGKDCHLTFYRIHFEHFGLVVDAVAELVETGTSEHDIAALIHEPADLLVCETCATRQTPFVNRQSLVQLAEIARQALDERKQQAGHHDHPGGAAHGA
jgi:hypothetical protein